MSRNAIRAFVAIDLPEAIGDVLARLQDDLQVGRRMAPETLHLTLAFLGEQPGPVVEAAHEALADLRAAPFALELRGVDVFGGVQPKVLWAGVPLTDALADLRGRIRRAVGTAGIQLPRERFRPHVTLARFTRNLPAVEAGRLAAFLARNAGFATDPFTVDRFLLYRSVLDREGAVHDVLAEYPLAP